VVITEQVKLDGPIRRGDELPTTKGQL